MSYDLISDADFERLPADPSQKFVAIEAICRRNLLASINDQSSGEFDNLMRTQYMTVVAAVADELGINGISYVNRYDDTQLNTEEFMRVVSGVSARIRLRGSSARDKLSVKLANKTKGIIESELSKLRDTVSQSPLEEAKRARLLEKIEEFRSELHKDRLSFGAAFSVLAVIGASLVGTTSLLADGPSAVATILALIGEDKLKEEAETLRLEGPTKSALITKQERLPAKRPTPDHDNEEGPPF